MLHFWQIKFSKKWEHFDSIVNLIFNVLIIKKFKKCVKNMCFKTLRIMMNSRAELVQNDPIDISANLSEYVGIYGIVFPLPPSLC
jgi:hypothetical protein